MLSIAKRSSQHPDAAAVLSKAVTNAAERLSVSQTSLAKILGLSPATISRMTAGRYQLDQQSKSWEFALIFVRIFRSLDSIVGNEVSARRWINGENLGLGGRPIELMTQTEGLVRVAHYLDASRGTV